MDRKGRTLYASNRGEDSISVFAIDVQTGRLVLRQTAPSAGKTPRFFTTTLDGRWCYLLNEDSDQIVRFAIGADGLLAESGKNLGVRQSSLHGFRMRSQSAWEI